MKLWEKFSKNIFNLGVQFRLKKVRPKLIESVLSKSLGMLAPEVLNEIRTFILNQQTSEGGFSDRGGKCDLYYTLFGFYIAEAHQVNEVMEPLKMYVAQTVRTKSLSGVYRFCGAILYARLIGIDSTSEILRTQIVADLINTDSQHPEYSSFLGILALYYLGDYYNIQKVINQFKLSSKLNEHSCPVVAATAIMLGMAGNHQSGATEMLKSFYRGNGGFAALHRAPSEDLLSTAVALYALHFLDADLRLIKPDCLAFVDDLYHRGGFCATTYDSISDAEYTFYGLLALGSMS